MKQKIQFQKIQIPAANSSREEKTPRVLIDPRCKKVSVIFNSSELFERARRNLWGEISSILEEISPKDQKILSSSVWCNPQRRIIKFKWTALEYLGCLYKK